MDVVLVGIWASDLLINDIIASNFLCLPSAYLVTFSSIRDK